MSQLERPIALVAQPQERVWGGGRIAELFRRDHDRRLPIGESWEIHGELRVASGPLQGRSLDSLVEQFGTALLGERGAAETTFPLLTKWLDCRDWLSVQVHPDDRLAQELTGSTSARGKSEAWYIASAAPEAWLLHGFTEKAVLDKLQETHDEQILELVQRLSPAAGDLLFTPAGTPHALGPGYLIYEIQQSSDLTYRLYDWGRDRPLHPAEARRCLKEIQPQAYVEQPTRLSCRYFGVEQLDGTRPLRVDHASFVLLAAMTGDWTLEGSFGNQALAHGQSLLLPAGLGQIGLRGEGTLLKIDLGEEIS